CGKFFVKVDVLCRADTAQDHVELARAALFCARAAVPFRRLHTFGSELTDFLRRANLKAASELSPFGADVEAILRSRIHAVSRNTIHFRRPRPFPPSRNPASPAVRPSPTKTSTPPMVISCWRLS